MECSDEAIKRKKKLIKTEILNILNSFDKESNNKFREILFQNLNDECIKYIIKIISYYTKIITNPEIKIKCYELFQELIKTISKKDIISNLIKILLYMQENINIFKINLSFELLINKLNQIEIKNFEILNGFCLINLQKDNIINKQALLCYQSLIKNCEKLIQTEIKGKVINSFIDIMVKKLLKMTKLFADKYLLLSIINDIILISKEKIKNHIEVIFTNILDVLSLNDNNIKSIILTIINNIIKFNPDKKKEIKDIIYPHLTKLNKDKFLNNMIKRLLFDINLNISSTKSQNSKKIIFRKEKSSMSFNNSSPKIFKDEIKKRKKTLKIKDLKHNINITCEIYESKKPNQINNFKNKDTKKNPFNKGNLIMPTFKGEEDYLNPIKLWYNFDSNISNKSESNKCSINFDKSINNNQINIINQAGLEPKLDLIINEIIKISNNQNIIAEKIVSLEKNTKKQLLYFEERLNQLENKESNNEIINKRVRILYPSNDANKKITEFLTSKDNDKSIFFLTSITENDFELIDNNLFEEVFDKLIYFLKNKIYIEEVIGFMKIFFTKNKKRFNIDKYKKLVSALDIIMKSNIKLNEQTSFVISWIISSINI